MKIYNEYELIHNVIFTLLVKQFENQIESIKSEEKRYEILIRLEEKASQIHESFLTENDLFRVEFTVKEYYRIEDIEIPF